MTTRVKAGESVDDAFERARAHLDRIARNSYAWKRQGFHERLEASR